MKFVAGLSITATYGHRCLWSYCIGWGTIVRVPFSVEKEQVSSLLAVALQVLPVTAKVDVSDLKQGCK